ncbi:hypothetical protein OSJ77_03865 [Phyllobacterium sp. 0TCS1.6C]|uniref:hypothetical protein n=1 Tax=unclassified Phyllobacterium TaxID=2638441 RepID=UPI0022650909|nr:MULTISPECIES: hypothetical protein [unclassified Phyllobacterium]MCX8279312.1 hypothetical protein [Phyllobacterium sp. 0TCS1.6C]MCX8294096.1 hypothetical protein [Phyllobacterium sp. 0TCS1.6A]
MQIGLWELRELKKALTSFCEDNGLELGDEAALRAAHQLLQLAQQQSLSADRLLRQLRTQNAGPTVEVRSQQPAEHRKEAGQVLRP